MKRNLRHPGIYRYSENGKPVCRVHVTTFGHKAKYENDLREVRYYCDGMGKKYDDDHPLKGIGFEYGDPDDPVTGWFKTEEGAVAAWKRMRAEITDKKRKAAANGCLHH